MRHMFGPAVGVVCGCAIGFLAYGGDMWILGAWGLIGAGYNAKLFELRLVEYYEEMDRP